MHVHGDSLGEAMMYGLSSVLAIWLMLNPIKVALIAFGSKAFQ